MSDPRVPTPIALHSANTHVQISAEALNFYYAGLARGENETDLLADALGAPHGSDPLHYLLSILAPAELARLRVVLAASAPKNTSKNGDETPS